EHNDSMGWFKFRQICAALCFLCGSTIVIIDLSGVVDRAIAQAPAAQQPQLKLYRPDTLLSQWQVKTIAARDFQPVKANPLTSHGSFAPPLSPASLTASFTTTKKVGPLSFDSTQRPRNQTVKTTVAAATNVT